MRTSCWSASAAVRCRRERIRLRHLRQEVVRARRDPSRIEPLDLVIARHVRTAVELTGGNVALAARALGRLSPRGIALLTGTLLAAALALSAFFDVYQTPFAAATPRASLLGVFR